jgi:hypothetical protein
MKRLSVSAKIILGALLTGACFTENVRAAEAFFGASDDNYILADTVGWSRYNWGIYPSLVVGLNDFSAPYRSLLRFDLSGLGAATSITSATLTLTTTRVDKLHTAYGNFDLRLFLLSNANKDWIEGAQVEYPAVTNEPCWRYRQLCTGYWAGGPGIGNSTNSAGIAALLGTVSVDVTNTVIGTAYTFTINTPEGISALTNWAAGGANAGFFMTTDEGSVTNAQNAIYFGSKENPTPACRPKLTVRTTTGDVTFGSSGDTFIWNAGYTCFSENNWGQSALLRTGTYAAGQPFRSLLRFDLTSLRACYNAMNGATLSFTVIDTNLLSVSRGNLNLRLLLLDNANADWTEGSKIGFPETGSACWEFRKNNTAVWTGGAGIGNSAASNGLSNLLATVTVDVATVTNGQKIVFALDSSAARSTLDTWARGGTNAGLLLASDETANGMNALGLGSAEETTLANRPVLAVTYTTDETAFAASADNFMYTSGIYTNFNWGKWSLPWLAVGLNSPVDAYRTLLRFDLTSLARAHKQVKWATLTLTEASNSKINPANGKSFGLRLLLPADANAGWGEGTKDAAMAGTGESCWAWQQYNTAPWVGGPGIGNSTNSVGVAAQLATATVNASTVNVGTNIVFYIESPAGLAALERWARGGTNGGFLLATDEASSGQNALFVASREHTTASYRPTLRVVLEPKLSQGTLIRVQ